MVGSENSDVYCCYDKFQFRVLRSWGIVESIRLLSVNLLGKTEDMGGCCCCSSSRRGDVDDRPAYYYYPRATEEHMPLSSAHDRTSSAVSTVSTGVVAVDTNLETSSPDSYVPPPPPMPFDVAIGVPQTPNSGEEATCVHVREASLEAANTEPVQETVDSITLGVPSMCSPKETDCKIQTEIDLYSAEDIDPKLSKAVFVPIEEEDCPICLEEYDIENPKLLAKCDHHFHLACILEWMERSEACPVCNKEMIFESPLD